MRLMPAVPTVNRPPEKQYQVMKAYVPPDAAFRHVQSVEPAPVQAIAPMGRPDSLIIPQVPQNCHQLIMV